MRRPRQAGALILASPRRSRRRALSARYARARRHARRFGSARARRPGALRVFTGFFFPPPPLFGGGEGGKKLEIMTPESRNHGETSVYFTRIFLSTVNTPTVYELKHRAGWTARTQPARPGPSPTHRRATASRPLDNPSPRCRSPPQANPDRRAPVRRPGIAWAPSPPGVPYPSSVDSRPPKKSISTKEKDP